MSGPGKYEMLKISTQVGQQFIRVLDSFSFSNTMPKVNLGVRVGDQSFRNQAAASLGCVEDNDSRHGVNSFNPMTKMRIKIDQLQP